MTGMERTWPADAFDAVSIKTSEGQIVIKGTDGDDFRLESESSTKHRDTLKVIQNGRWLQLSSMAKNDNLKLTLYFPRQKVWLLELVARQASFQAEDITGWLHLMIGKGEVNVENCRGALTVISGGVELNIKNFIETEVPEKPPQPEEVLAEEAVTSARFPDWGKDDWANWGLDIGERVLRKIFDQTEDAGKTPGISFKIAKGSLQIQDMEAKSCVVRSARSDVKLKGGRISSLDVNIVRGDIVLDSCIPSGEWIIRANHGNINFSSTPEVSARLNAATRSGEINSSVPLVKVTRQGPGAWHGGRMVGTIGVSSDIKDKIPEIRLSALRGDINIMAGSVAGHYPGKPSAPKAPPPLPKPSRKTGVSYQTPVEVLGALSKGQISVDDAEKILDSLGYWNKTT